MSVYQKLGVMCSFFPCFSLMGCTTTWAAAAAARNVCSCSPSSTSDHSLHLAIGTDIILHYNYVAEHIVGQRCEEHETYLERNDNALFLPWTSWGERCYKVWYIRRCSVSSDNFNCFLLHMTCSLSCMFLHYPLIVVSTCVTKICAMVNTISPYFHDRSRMLAIRPCHVSDTPTPSPNPLTLFENSGFISPWSVDFWNPHWKACRCCPHVLMKIQQILFS